MTTRLLPRAVVLDRASISKTQLYRLINTGQFPKPVPIGQRRIAFLESEFVEWIAERVRRREEGVGAASRRAMALRAVEAKR